MCHRFRVVVGSVYNQTKQLVVFSADHMRRDNFSLVYKKIAFELFFAGIVNSTSGKKEVLETVDKKT